MKKSLNPKKTHTHSMKAKLPGDRNIIDFRFNFPHLLFAMYLWCSTTSIYCCASCRFFPFSFRYSFHLTHQRNRNCKCERWKKRLNKIALILIAVHFPLPSRTIFWNNWNEQISNWIFNRNASSYCLRAIRI